ncbi:Testis-specific serine/threonine-protein kinase 4 [Anthophora retusa]
MASAPVTNNSPKALLTVLEDKSDDKSEKKLTVLESHGYTLGKTIGAGSYATVKKLSIIVTDVVWYIAPLSETFCGSYAYASPEILKGVPYLPQLSDVWSMGVVLFAMVYGRLPFDDTNYNQLLKQVQSKVTYPKEPKVSQACRSLISRILVPQRMRLDTDHIRQDIWLATALATAQTSTTDTLMALPMTPNAKEMIAEKNKGTNKHVTNVGPQVVEIPSSNLSTLDQNNNKYLHLR